MDNFMIYLFYLVIIALLTLLIWVFIRQGGDPHDPHRRMRNGHKLNGQPDWGFNHQEIEDNGDE